MVTLSKTWTFDLNNVFADQTSQVAQYREMWWAFVEAHRRAGWTVTHSSDGVTSGTGDRILSPANVTIGGTFAGAARSWAVMTPPAVFYGKAGATIPAELMSQLFVAQDNSYNPGTNQPRIIVHTWNSGGSYTGGSTTTNPSPAGGNTTDIGGSGWRNTWLNWATPTPAQYSYLYSADGEVWFFNKRLNVASADASYMARTFRAVDEGLGDYRYVFFANGATAGALQTNSWTTSAAWTGRDYVGAILSSISAYSLAWSYSGWTDGAELPRSATYSSIRVGANGSLGAARRDYGVLPDVWGCPGNQIQNRVFHGDTDPIRQVALASSAGGSIWLPAPRADLPIL